MQPQQPQQQVPQTTPEQPERQKWWKTRKGLTACAYFAFALAAGFAILALSTGKPTSFSSALIFTVAGIVWLVRANKMPRT